MAEENLGEIVQKLKGQITGLMGRIDEFKETGHDVLIPDYEGLQRLSLEAAASIQQVDRYLADRGLVSPPKSNIETEAYRVVHVDDTPNIRDLVRDILMGTPEEPKTFRHLNRNVTYIVDSYGSVDEALNALSQNTNQVDILISDKKMGGGNGFDLFDKICDSTNKAVRRPEFGHVKNIAMFSGAIEETDVSRAQIYGAILIAKPIDIQQLEQQIYRVLKNHQS